MKVPDQPLTDMLKKVWVRSRQLPPKLAASIEWMLPVLLLLTFSALVLETVTYKGFVVKYYGLSAEVLLITSLLAVGYCWWSEQQRKFPYQGRLLNLLLDLNALFLIPLSLFYYLVTKLESQHYPNYVFAHFHVLPANIFILWSFSVLCAIFWILRKAEIKQWLYQQKISLIQVVFFAYIAWLFVPQLTASSVNAYHTLWDITIHLDKSYDDKFVQLLNGNQSLGWMYTYTRFIKKHVPETATLFIPPQKTPWLMEGNPYLMRWFLYPRRLVSGPADTTAQIPSDIKYIMIAEGAWPAGNDEFGWPKINVSSNLVENKFFIDRVTLREYSDQKAYDWQDHRQEWGVLILK